MTRAMAIRPLISKDMKMTILIISSAVLVCVIAYYFLFPENRFITFYFKDKSGVVFSKTRISYQPAPDRYSTNGIDQIPSYISKLIVPSTKFKFLFIFTPDGQRGLSLTAKDGQITVGFTVDWRKHPEKEKNIRSYFKRLDIEPIKDYLGGNGGVADATRLLSYPIAGAETTISSLVKDMLQHLCDISSKEALDIRCDD